MDEKGKPRSPDEIRKNIQNVTFATHCHGGFVAYQIEKIPESLRIFLNKHKIPFKFFMAVKKRMMSKRIKERIAEFKRDGKDAVIYDIRGRRVKSVTSSGVYVIDGKKTYINK